MRKLITDVAVSCAVLTSLLAFNQVLAKQANGNERAHRHLAQPGCKFANGIRHVVHITFDNVHLRRDNPNVPSDLEQMPSLLNFLADNGSLSSNHHTVLI